MRFILTLLFFTTVLVVTRIDFVLLVPPSAGMKNAADKVIIGRELKLPTCSQCKSAGGRSVPERGQGLQCKEIHKTMRAVLAVQLCTQTHAQSLHSPAPRRKEHTGCCWQLSAGKGGLLKYFFCLSLLGWRAGKPTLCLLCTMLLVLCCAIGSSGRA